MIFDKLLALFYRAVLEFQYRKKDVQRGFPDANGNTNVTWCNRFVFRVLKIMGYNINPILNITPGTHRKSEGWTNANSICRNAERELKEIKIIDAYRYACHGIPALITWRAVKGSGHVALAAPSNKPLDKKLGIYCCQAGWYNGFFYTKDRRAFGNRKPLKYYLLEKG